jgi:hypothetical protein
MKIHPHQARQRGSAILVLLGILALLFVVIAANQGSLKNLRRGLKIVETQQLKRWAVSSATATNAASEVRP